MNNYDEIAKETVDKVLKETALITLKGVKDLMYKCAYEAAKLQAERFNDDLDASYIKYLEHKSEEELC